MDTDVVSTLRKATPSPAVLAWFERTPASELATSVITVTEIQCGIEKQRRSNPGYASVTETWLDGLLGTAGLPVLPLDWRAALILGRMYETAALRNFVIPSPGQKTPKTAGDLAIAAVAIVNGATLATGNTGHFQQIHAHFPLPGLYNPFKDEWLVPRPTSLS